jgi:hypothetical protein
LAVSLAFGAVQFASGSDLGNGGRVDAAATANAVNRAAKADRIAKADRPGLPGQTVSFRLHSLSDTSVLMRLPAARVNVDAVTPRPTLRPASQRRSTVACEPVVSVLTEVAKLLEPGRCVT